MNPSPGQNSLPLRSDQLGPEGVLQSYHEECMPEAHDWDSKPGNLFLSPLCPVFFGQHTKKFLWEALVQNVQ